MEYQCGNCNTPLTEAALAGGVCPQCGAPVGPRGDERATLPQPAVPADPALASAADDPAATFPSPSKDAGPAADAAWGALPPADAEVAFNAATSWPVTPFAPPEETARVPVGPRFTDGPLQDTQERLELVRTSRATGRLADPVGPKTLHVPPAGLLAGIAVAIFMVLLCAIAATSSLLQGFTGVNLGTVPSQVTGRRITPGATGPAGLGFPTQNPDPTPLPFLQSTPTFVPTSTPYGGPPTPTPIPSPTPSPTPSASPTPSGGSQAMTVTPSQIQMQCPGINNQLTVTNQSNSTLNWNASSNNSSFALNPTQGHLNAGQQQSITVTAAQLTNPGQAIVTFMDDAGDPPTLVQISCK
jgi:hypothetical protein